MKWVLIAILLLTACSSSSEAYVFRPKKHHRREQSQDLKTALQAGYWVVDPAATLVWYDFREDNQCSINWVEEGGVLREVYCIWFLHDREGDKKARLDLVIPILTAVAFSDVVWLDGDVVRLEGKPDILKHSPTYPYKTLPRN